jgi:DNA-directed RNA polymerase beta subunit
MSLLNNKDNKKIVDDMNYEDYVNAPIDSFGINMLKKMGWQENKTINGKIQPKVFELKPRHYRLGLGATPLDPTKEPVKSSDADKLKKEREKNFFGTKVKITHGKHKGLKAIIAEKIICEDLNEYFKKNEFVKVELKINKEVINIEYNNIKLRSNEKDEKNIKKKNKKMDKKKKSKREHSSDYSSSSEKSEKDLAKSDKNYNKEKEVLETKEEILQFLNKKTNRDKIQKSNFNFHEIYNPNEKPDDINNKSKTKLNWLMQNLIVRIVNKKNRYYNKEATVIDLPSADKFTLIAIDGNLIENLCESEIETVIPQVGERVVVLKGEDKGEFGEIMQQDFDSGIITLQMLNDFSIKSFRNDQCCAIGNSI